MRDLIEKTRDQIPLSGPEIDRLVTGIVDQTWPDYQLAAWLMAVTLRGLTSQETFAPSLPSFTSGSGFRSPECNKACSIMEADS